MTQARYVAIISVAAVFWPVLATAGLKEDIDKVLATNSQRNVQYSVQVVRASDGTVVYDHKAKEGLIPASNMKLAVSAAALGILGSDYQYVTRVGFAGEALVVIGSGDPLFADREVDARNSKPAGWVVDDIVKAVKESGRTRVKDIIIDSTVFDDERVHPSWPREQLNRRYAAEICGVNFMSNCVEITGTTVGKEVSLSLSPPTNYVTVINRVQPVTSGPDTMWFSRDPGGNTMIGRGNCNVRTMAVQVTVERPGAMLGHLLAERLAAAGLTVEGKLVERGIDEQEGFVEIIRYSTPLTEVFARCNKDSLGLAAESMIKTLSAKSNGGKGGSWPGGRAVLGEWLKGLGVGEGEFKIDDGSGLSRDNRLSANALNRVLLHVYRSESWGMFKDSLSIGGVDGTAARWFTEPRYRGRIFAKTGYISGVRSLSGVCQTQNGDYLFAIITNRGTGETRDSINAIVRAIIDNNR